MLAFKDFFSSLTFPFHKVAYLKICINTDRKPANLLPAKE